MYDWKTTLLLSPRTARLLVTDPLEGDRLKAVLPPRPDHPRAMLTLLEGLALWRGRPITAAISVGRSVDRCFVRALLGDGVLDSALVRLIEVDPDRRQRSLFGLGDFRAVRKAGRRS